MNFGELIYQQPEDIKKLIRKIENLERKLANARVAILFNKTCLNIYMYIYIYVYIQNCNNATMYWDIYLLMLHFIPA